MHADVLHAGRILSRFRGREAWLAAHLELLAVAADGRGIWMPTFHYGFTRTGRFDVGDDPSEVGVLSEYFRTHLASWRTPVPVFSFAGTGAEPAVAGSGVVDPFGADSAFADMVRRDAALLFYGAPFSSSTIKHLVERGSGRALYRYDKDFTGTVTLADGTVRTITLHYHVRPRGRTLAYDDPRLLRDALEAGVVRSSPPGAGSFRLIAASTRRLVGYWTERLAEDPLYFLDGATRDWVEPLLDRLGRPFEAGDFGDEARVRFRA